MLMISLVYLTGLLKTLSQGPYELNEFFLSVLPFDLADPLLDCTHALPPQVPIPAALAHSLDDLRVLLDLRATSLSLFLNVHMRDQMIGLDLGTSQVPGESTRSSVLHQGLKK